MFSVYYYTILFYSRGLYCSEVDVFSRASKCTCTCWKVQLEADPLCIRNNMEDWERWQWQMDMVWISSTYIKVEEAHDIDKNVRLILLIMNRVRFFKDVCYQARFHSKIQNRKSRLQFAPVLFLDLISWSWRRRRRLEETTSYFKTRFFFNIKFWSIYQY